eukprot:TRINITY_DN15447_c0_g1_i1.p1 TRINITY_DN15447_c0_g1~~TRINITY_DN15447_c0_g1_i1.p1  ORF type:complete len:1423 (-),score=349.76 TRINITY_DN15447_c0_g1_i1:57-4325(-)
MEGAKVYVRDAAGNWQKATVASVVGNSRYKVQLEPWEEPDGHAPSASSTASGCLEVDASSMDGGTLPFQNKNMPDNGFPDMTALDHLHEAALLHNLRVRFLSHACPYTYTADIVIAVNPYRWFPQLYSEELRKEYLVFDRAKLTPHVYAASSVAYAGLKESNMDQAILVSGESGAGKTETVKILMGHLALIASSDDSTHIKRIVESNPLLEAFGNAQTVRNDNSSRFGKFIELQVDTGCHLVGSQCRTYLLEKSRVVSQDTGERNYHIFYQMLAADPEVRTSIGLGGQNHNRDKMRYTRLGTSKTDTIEGMHDSERFKGTVSALALVGVDGAVLTQMLRALASVLLLGEVEFDGSNGAETQDDIAKVTDGAAENAKAAAANLEVDAQALAQALTHRTLKTRNESIVKSMPPSAATATRDALSKELYARLFDWLVAKICAATRAAAGDDVKHFVGLLDIFGFESFAINRFEQLCINYANEKLQQKFTLDVFKSVQQEYSDEGIPWDRIEFKDNAPVLALIESKMGICAMLNEEGVRPKGSDENFVAKLGTVHKEDPAFSRPKLGAQKELQFAIKHYAGTVTYTATGWLDRNKDSISDDVVDLLRSSQNPIIAEVFAEAPGDKAATDAPAGKKMGSDTVVTKFKTSLAQLMETVGKTHTQYVRCIKPNKEKSPILMDHAMVVDQLRCAGVVEAIRVSRAGFPARIPLKDFVARFTPLARCAAGLGFKCSTVVGTDAGASKSAAAALAAIKDKAEPTAACRALAGALVPAAAGDRQAYEVGRTRVYFKGGVLEKLEERRALLLQAAATEMTRRVRGRQERERFACKRHTAVVMQSLQRMRRQRNAYLRVQRAVVRFQSARRAVLAKRQVAWLRRERCAARIQAAHRRRVAMRSLARARKAAVCLQAAVRRRYCRKQYIKDLAEFKEQAKLENQVKALQAKLAAQEKAFAERASSANATPNAANATATPAPACSGDPPVEILEALNALTAENQKLRLDNERQRNEIAALRKEVQHLRAEQSTRGDMLNSIKREHKADLGRNRHIGSSSRTASHDRGPGPGRLSRQNSAEAAAMEKISSDMSTGTSLPSRGRKGLSLKLHAPMNDFWEVHVKLGANILMVDETSKNVVWASWLDVPVDSGRGYRRCMSFFIERVPGAENKTDKMALDGTVGDAFTLRSGLTGKYIQIGGMLDRSTVRCTGMRPEDAAAFTFVELFDGAAPEVSAQVDGAGSAVDYLVALKMHKEHKVLRLRSEGQVCVAAVSTPNDLKSDRTAASFEYLLPRASYEIPVKQEQIGISLSRDLPLRVLAFRPVALEPNGASGPGPAERSGRVRLGDHVTTVNGQDIGGIPCSDVLSMIACRRPVTIGFSVAQDSTFGVGSTSPPQKREKRKSLFSFGKRSSVALDTAMSAAAQLLDQAGIAGQAGIDI